MRLPNHALAVALFDGEAASGAGTSSKVLASTRLPYSSVSNLGRALPLSALVALEQQRQYASANELKQSNFNVTRPEGRYANSNEVNTVRQQLETCWQECVSQAHLSAVRTSEL